MTVYLQLLHESENDFQLSQNFQCKTKNKTVALAGSGFLVFTNKKVAVWYLLLLVQCQVCRQMPELLTPVVKQIKK